MINVLINGCNGKMGKEIAKQVSKTDNMCIAAGVDILDLGDNKFPVYSNTDDIKEEIHVIIDFSIPKATINILEYANKKHIPIVIATTGFNDEEKEKIVEYSKSIPIFQSANMSLGINLMIKLLEQVSKVLKDGYDIEIVEKHHRNKIDSPSGTALMLADSIKNSLENEVYYEYNRQAKREKRNNNEIGIHSIRGGNIVGNHSVSFIGENESLEIVHDVTSRSVFAEGAVKAAEYITYKENGMYSMKDLV